MSKPSATVRDIKWRAVTSNELLWHGWDEDHSVVYHLLSGHTHIFNQVTAAAIEILQARRLCAEDLAARLAETLHCPGDEQLIDEVRSLLATLDELGLVEPVT